MLKKSTPGSLPEAYIVTLTVTASRIERETKTRPTKVLEGDSGYSLSCGEKKHYPPIQLCGSDMPCELASSTWVAWEWNPVPIFGLLTRSVHAGDKGKQQEQGSEDAHTLWQKCEPG